MLSELERLYERTKANEDRERQQKALEETKGAPRADETKKEGLKGTEKEEVKNAAALAAARANEKRIE
jgi:hypothetical protein